MIPERKGVPSQAEAERIRAAVAWKRAAEAELVAAVLDAMDNGASLRETAMIAEVSERTPARWRLGQGAPPSHEIWASRARGDRLLAREWYRQHGLPFGDSGE